MRKIGTFTLNSLFFYYNIIIFAMNGSWICQKWKSQTRRTGI